MTICNSNSRREFLKKVPPATAWLMGLSSFKRAKASTSAVGPRPRTPNPFLASNGKPLLVCVEGTDFQAMLRRGIDLLGGLDRLIDNNQDVFIKPNFNYRCPYPGISSVSGVRSVVCEVKDSTSGTVRVGDEGFSSGPLVYDYLDLEHPVTSAGAELVTLSSTTAVRAEHWGVTMPDHEVYTDIYNASILFNLCSLKRHHTALMTCALKNNVGAVAGALATGTRSYLHSLMGSEFQQEVAEIAGIINPNLNIIDARAVLTVNGPVTADGVVVNANKIILCGDMVATDVYCAQLLAEHDTSFDPAVITPLLDHAESLGLGTKDLQQIQVVEATES